MTILKGDPAYPAYYALKTYIHNQTCTAPTLTRVMQSTYPMNVSYRHIEARLKKLVELGLVETFSGTDPANGQPNAVLYRVKA
ncbi:hypothetical protein ACP26L_36500 (plasmid) [Paenibacillus sp. S-38]|uniref:hypothetical protein n=1 Tax=Paenibacillus sp. S-38 TaxID=3416710 RepID=UPI003CEC2D41